MTMPNQMQGASMDTQRLDRLLTALTVSFLVELATTVLFVVLVSASSSEPFSPILAVCLLGMVVAGLAFYILLGSLASRMGKSWIVWVGLTIITKPIGSFVAYFMIRQRVKTAIDTNVENA